MIRAIVCGAGGRMGGRIITLMAQDGELKLFGAVERKEHPLVGKDIGECLGIGKMEVFITDDLRNCIDKGDVIIDFTSPEASLNHLRLASEFGKAMVIGSTGFTKEELEEIKKLAQMIPLVLSPNMSIGVNILFKLVEMAAQTLGDEYDVEIIEAHHHHKKDAPSGTAMKLAEIITEKLNRNMDVCVYQRRGFIGERSRKEIGIQVIRGGDIVGDHIIMFCGEGERIELIHRAHSRDNFAKGAIRAAKWVVNQKKGLYNMQDVLALGKDR